MWQWLKKKLGKYDAKEKKMDSDSDITQHRLIDCETITIANAPTFDISVQASTCIKETVSELSKPNGRLDPVRFWPLVSADNDRLELICLVRLDLVRSADNIPLVDGTSYYTCLLADNHWFDSRPPGKRMPDATITDEDRKHLYWLLIYVCNSKESLRKLRREYNRLKRIAEQEEYRQRTIVVDDINELRRRGLMTRDEVGVRYNPDDAALLTIEMLKRLTNPDKWEELCKRPQKYLNRYVWALCRRHHSWATGKCIGKLGNDPCPLLCEDETRGCSKGSQAARMERAIRNRHRKDFRQAQWNLVKKIQHYLSKKSM